MKQTRRFKLKLVHWIGVCALVLLAGMAGMAGTVFSSETPKTRQYYEQRGEIVWEVPIAEKWIALTFDDGPGEKDTPQVSELLKQYGAQSTFFVIGERVARFPNTARKLITDGHELANHTFKHTYFSKQVSEAAIDNEIRKTEEAVASMGGTLTTWFRPPGGYYNERLVQSAKKRGYTLVLWSWHQDTKDWKSPGVQKIVNKVLNNARNGDIVLFHDHGEGSHQTIEALKTILPELQRRGFRCVTVSELMGKRHEAVKPQHPNGSESTAPAPAPPVPKDH